MVEDNRNDVFLIREAISAARVTADIHVVHDGDEAIRFFDAAEFDENAPRPTLVLLDMNLPRKNGDDVLKRLRSSPKFRDAAVLIVSSSDAKRDHEAVAGFGISGYFRKPFILAEFMKLGEIVKNLLNQ